MNYTPEQKKAIETVDQSLVVTAGAGAGKTRVLVDRIIYLLTNGFADIDQIVAITYTKKAALEIRERLRREIKKQKTNLTLSESLKKLGIAYIGTVHSFCLRILQENPVEANIDPNAKVLEEYRGKAWLKDCIQEAIINNLNNNIVYQLTSEIGFSKLSKELHSIMSKMMNLGLKPDVLSNKTESEEEKTLVWLIHKAYEFYNMRKDEEMFLDYEDILQKTLELLRGNKDILHKYKNKFKYIMIDEYQDLNYVQDAILRLLGEGTNLFVVGDKKQSIYGFRGARVELFEKLKKDLESYGQAINLRDNFRSDQRIISFVNDSFNGLIDKYEPIDAHRCHEDKNNLLILMPESEGLMSQRRQHEAEFIARKILEMMTDETIKIFDKNTKEYRPVTFRDFSVLLRKKTHLQHYINAFKTYNIPYHVANPGSLLESQCVKNLICALRTIEFKENISLYGTLSHLLKVSDETLAQFILDQQELIKGLEEDVDYTGISKNLAQAFKLIQSWCKIKDKSTLRELAGIIVVDTQLLSHAAQKDILETENLFKFLDLCRYYDGLGFSLKDFLKELSEFGEDHHEALDTAEEEDVVKFITIHSSKGLEFPIVILADSGQEISGRTSEILFEPELGIALKKDKDKWETLKNSLARREIEEAKRVLYVALTRARDYLLISGEIKSEKKDSFLKWINPETAAIGNVSPMVIMREPPQIVTKDINKSLEYRKTQLKKPKFTLKSVKIPKYYSVTLLGDFIRCPKRYYLSHEMGIPESAFLKHDRDFRMLSARERGTIVHEIIEKIQRDNLKAKDITKILDKYDKIFLAAEDKAFINRCINNYLESDLYRTGGLIYSELPFIYRLKKKCYITGKVDNLIIEDDGAIVADFKTNASIRPALMESYCMQVAAYALAINEIYGVPIKKGIIASLFEGRIIEIDISTKSLDEHKKNICEIVSMIERNDFKQKPREKSNCDICGYKEILCR
ncbi:MAG: UvrD-helicase domain-containing protein [Tepidanaerobacteraceae bacterium]